MCQCIASETLDNSGAGLLSSSARRIFTTTGFTTAMLLITRCTFGDCGYCSLVLFQYQTQDFLHNCSNTHSESTFHPYLFYFTAWYFFLAIRLTVGAESPQNTLLVHHSGMHTYIHSFFSIVQMFQP